MTNWQRLEQVISWSGHSTHAFAKAIGLKRSENLYQIKRGSFGISKELARVITVKYPQINYAWLLTGEGSMINTIKEDTPPPRGVIPFYDVDALEVLTVDDEDSAESKATTSTTENSSESSVATGSDTAVVAGINSNIKPQYHLTLPALAGSDFAAKHSGGSMEPIIPSGATVVFKHVNMDSLLMGEAYLVCTSDFAVIRYVRRIEGDNTSLLLVPSNLTDFDQMVIKRKQIKHIYMVKGVIQYR